MRRFSQQVTLRDDLHCVEVFATVVGVLSEGMPEWCMDLVDVEWPVLIGMEEYDEDEFEAFFPGLTEAILGSVDDDDWEEIEE